MGERVREMAEDLYPLQFEPYLKEFVWGSRKLETVLRKELPPSKLIGESWEIFDADRIRNGPLSGMTLSEATRRFGERLLGNRVRDHQSFPLLLKLSATELPLSVQVHPDDEQAKRLEQSPLQRGKEEMICVLDAAAGANVILGLKERVDLDAVRKSLAVPKRFLDLLQVLPLQPGDAVFVAPGTVHAYGAGLVYFELQQNSDITYRLFDWSRLERGKPRELHIEKALQVIDLDAVNPPKVGQICLSEDYGRRCMLAACRYFAVERLDISNTLVAAQSGASFHILCAIEGGATLVSPSPQHPELRMSIGDVVLLPASISEYRIVPEGTCRILRSYVPDLKRDVVDHLLQRGVPTSSILTLGGARSSHNDLAPLIKRG